MIKLPKLPQGVVYLRENLDGGDPIVYTESLSWLLYRGIIDPEEALFDADQMKWYAEAHAKALQVRLKKAQTILDTILAALRAENTRLRSVLGDYANPMNWDVDGHGIRRFWREPASSTPRDYNGFELARYALNASRETGGYSPSIDQKPVDTELVSRIHAIADEISEAGHNGWGNELRDIAAEMRPSQEAQG